MCVYISARGLAARSAWFVCRATVERLNKLSCQPDWRAEPGWVTLSVQEREGGTEREMNRKGEGEQERKWEMEKRRAKIRTVNFVWSSNFFIFDLKFALTKEWFGVSKLHLLQDNACMLIKVFPWFTFVVLFLRAWRMLMKSMKLETDH